jgi:outer membrane protein assembly factor BamA
VADLNKIFFSRGFLVRFLLLNALISIFSNRLYSQTAADSVIFVNEIKIRGNNTTKDYVILREMSLKAGDTLNQKAIERDKNNIYNLGLFNKVDIEYSVELNKATILVTVTERWYFIPFPVIGMKYRDLSKIYYGAGIAHMNFRGQNEKLFSTICFGYDRRFSLNYSDPKLTDDYMFWSASIALQEVHNLSKISTEYLNKNVFLNGTIGKRFGMYQMLAGSMGYEVWQVGDLQLRRTVAANGRDAFVSAAVTYRYDTRNDREYTTDGTLVSLYLGKNGFGESEVNLTGFSYDLRQFFGFNEGSGFGLRTIGSFTWGGVIPPYRHVFFGYDERIRGYFHKVIEEENRIAANAELRLPILLPHYLVIDWIEIPALQKLRYGIYFGIFADAGRAWSRNDVFAEQPWYSGVGAGFQFLLPYAFTIRAEVALNNLGKVEYYIDFDTSF